MKLREMCCRQWLGLILSLVIFSIYGCALTTITADPSETVVVIPENPILTPQVEIEGFEIQEPSQRRGNSSQGVTTGFDFGSAAFLDSVEDNTPEPEEPSLNEQFIVEDYSPLAAVLLLELNVLRDDSLAEAVAAMIIYAQRTNNLRVISRAYELAQAIYDRRQAREAARVWYEMTEDDERAYRYYLRELLLASDYLRAFDVLGDRLAQGGTADFISLATLYQITNAAAGYNLLENLSSYAEIYPEAQAELYAASMIIRLNLARFLLYQEDYPAAVSLVDEVLSDPETAEELNIYQQASEIKGRIYYLTNAPDSETFFTAALARSASSYPLNIHYSLYLIRQGQVAAAEAWLLDFMAEHLVDLSDQLLLTNLGLGAIKENLPQVYAAVNEFLRNQLVDENLANLLLGALAFSNGDIRGAEDLLSRVDFSSYLTQATQLRLQNAINNNDLEAANNILAEISEANRPAYIFLSGQYALYLHESGLVAEARDFLTQLRAREFPDELLINTLAFIYYDLDYLDEMVQEFERLLEINPGPSTKNSYGYSITDKNINLTQAKNMIDEAVAAEPNSAAYVDSLGWWHFRRGNLREAETLLGWAFNRERDPEIAAHFGEVLWMLGKTEQARYVWLVALENNPGSKALIDTLARFGVSTELIDQDSHFFNTDLF